MWLVLAIIAAALFCLCIQKRRAHFNTFKHLGIPGPEPGLFFGNGREYLSKGFAVAFDEWHRHYGPVVGFFIGQKPMLLVADAELIKNIFITDFTDFTDREPIHGATTLPDSLLGSKGQEWKGMRKIITPSFTSMKLRSLSAYMHLIVNEMITTLNGNLDHEIDIKIPIQAMTLDVICRSALGVNYNVQTEPESNDLFIKIRHFLDRSLTFPIIAALSVGLKPSFIKHIREIIHNQSTPKNENVTEHLLRECASIVKARRSAQTEQSDLLQLLMEASATLFDQVSAEELTAGDEADKETGKHSVSGSTKLSDAQIVQNALAILIAGFETTASTLAYLINILIHRPEVQEKICDEIRSNLTCLDDIKDFERIQNLDYMDSVVRECLRMFPPVGPFSVRTASKNKVYEKLKIPQGMHVVASILEIHYSTQYWTDPKSFDPTRFQRGEPFDSAAWQPFGVGPRNCVGMRFAQMEIKMVLAELIWHFKFEKTPGSPSFPPEIEHIHILSRLSGPLICRVVKR